jgi:hypothetical protein
MKAKTVKASRSAYLLALTLSLCLTLLAVKVDLSQSVNNYIFYPVC